MLLNHTQDFAAFQPATTSDQTEMQVPSLPMPKREELSAFTSATMVETTNGWQAADTLGVGDAVYTMDGGFAEITGIQMRQLAAGPSQQWHVPAGSLNNCSDLRLTGGQYVAMIEPECETLFQTHCVLVPVAAMTGFRGISAVTSYAPVTAIELEFASEEIVYAQTGTLLHVPHRSAEPFFRSLGYGETRALLSMINGAHCGLDERGFAPARAA